MYRTGLLLPDMRTIFDEGPAEEFSGKIWPLPLFYGGSQVWLTFSGTIRNLPPLFRKFQQRVAFSRLSRDLPTQASAF